jgi:membrane-bound ClpP family serine protease
MDESTLQDRLDRIEQRQYLMLVLLVVPYLFLLAEFVGYWIAGVVGVGIVVVVLALVAVDRRRDRNTVEG